MPKQKLTVKQAKLVKGRAEGKTILQAANDANYLPNAKDEVRRVEASKTLQKPYVKEALDIAFKKHGIDLDSAIAPIGKALKAKKVVQIEGDFFETEVEDLDMQIKGSDRALKLMGVTGQSEGNNIQTNFVQIINQKAEKYSD